MARQQQSQFAYQFRQQLSPMIEELQDISQQTIDPSSVRQRRKVNKAVLYFTNGLDLIEKAFLPKKTAKTKHLDNGERSGYEERTTSHRRQMREETV